MDYVRTLLHAAVEDTPPERMEVRELIHTGKKSVKRRRWVVAGGTTITLAAAAVLGVVLLPGAGGGSTVEPATAAAPAPSAPPEKSKQPTQPETPEQAKQRLTGVLREAFRKQAPDTRLAAVRVGTSLKPGPLEFINTQSGVGYYASAETSDAAGKGQVSFEIDPPAPAGEPTPDPWGRMSVRKSAPAPAPARCTGCTTRTAPTGETIGIQEHSGLFDVRMTRADGTRLYLTAWNWSRNDFPSGSGLNPKVQRPTPPLTIDQMVAIITTPALTLRS